MSVAVGTAGEPARSAYIAKETALSTVINAVFSLAFFLGIFGLDPAVSVHIGGSGGFAFDFLPQSFVIALMSTLVPSAITAARIHKGRIGGISESTRRLLMRSVVTAILMLAVGGAIGLALAMTMGSAQMSWGSALGIKIAYGAALALVVTPVGLRVALRRTVFH